jgi:hypothetical protein
MMTRTTLFARCAQNHDDDAAVGNGVAETGDDDIGFGLDESVILFFQPVGCGVSNSERKTVTKRKAAVSRYMLHRQSLTHKVQACATHTAKE